MSYLVANPEDKFSRDEAHMYILTLANNLYGQATLYMFESKNKTLGIKVRSSSFL